MGTAARFNEEARACFIARLLAAWDYGTLWDPEHPNVVMTAASQTQLRDLTTRYPGVVEDWYNQPKIDV